MRKFLTQNARRTSFESADDLVRRFFGRGFNEQMNVVGLDSQLQNRPSAFVRDFFTQLAQAIRHRANQHFLAPFRNPDEVVAHLIHRMTRSLQFAPHVDSIALSTTKSKGKRSHPSAKAEGFPAPQNYNDAAAAPTTDLELVRKLILMLQDKNGLHLTNADTYVDLIEHPKFDEAFAIAYQAVYHIEVQPVVVSFVHEAIRAVKFFIDNPRSKARSI